jgi:hypothetical protein
LTAEWWRCEEAARGAAPKRGQKIRRLDSSIRNFARAEGAERYLRRGSVITGTQILTDRPPRTDTGAAVVPMLASASRSQSGYIWVAEQAQAGALPPHHGAEPAPRALGPVRAEQRC